MTIRHGQFAFPGISAPVRCTYTCSHGITPGSAVLTCLPQADLPPGVGDLIIGDGLTAIRVPRCKVDRFEVTQDGGGILWHFYLLDRRWTWRDFGKITGAYNQLDPHGIYYPWTIKVPSELCRLCLEAMGEVNFLINVTDNALPPTNWDYTSPGQALAYLADFLGCRVVYDPISDAVGVLPAGLGANLPPGSVQSQTPAIDLPERPDRITLVGAPVRFQLRLATQAVGEDWDTFYRPLKDLTYAPPNPPDPDFPWRYAVPPFFGGLSLTGTERLTYLQALELAQRSVYKYYRVVNVDASRVEVVNGARPELAGDNPIPVPPVGTLQVGKLTRREQLVLEHAMVEQIQPFGPDEQIFDSNGQRIIFNFYNGFLRDLPAQCYGSRYIGSTGLIHGTNKVTNTPEGDIIYVPFEIDPNWQLVKFQEFVFLGLEATGAEDSGKLDGIAPANVLLECACQIRDAQTNQVYRYERTRDFPPPHFGTPPLFVHHDDVVLNAIGEYKDQEGFTDVLTGVRLQGQLGLGPEDTVARADHYLAHEQRKFLGGLAEERLYNGIVPIQLDGAVQQVTWSVGAPGGAVTRASRNSEHAAHVPPLVARNRLELAPAINRRKAQRRQGFAVSKQQVLGLLGQAFGLSGEEGS